MPGDNILDSTSFSVLGDTPQQVLEDTPEQVLEKLFDPVTGQMRLDANQVFRDRSLIASSYKFYSEMLDKTDPVAFNYMNSVQKAALERDLVFALYVVTAQHKLAAKLALDAAESSRENTSSYRGKITQCAALIKRLRASPIITPEDAHELHLEGEDHGHLAYAAISIIPRVIAEGIDAIIAGDQEAVEDWSNLKHKLKHEGKTVLAKEARTAINIPRLYWVWTNGWLQTLINLLSGYFARAQQALGALSKASPFTGFLSFGLYLTSAVIETMVVAKHTIRSRRWMNDEEYNLKINGHDATAWQRFKAHAGLRKYSLINDFIWGLGNLACFFWLVGTGALGYSGNVATTALLLMDVVVSGFVYLEEKKQYNADLKRYERDIKQLEGKIEAAEGGEKSILQEQLRTLKKARGRCIFEWTHKTHKLVKDLVYATALVLSFVVMCCCLLPPTVALAPVAGVILGGVGATMCFVFSLVNDVMSGYLDITKSKALAKQAKAEIETGLEDAERGLLQRFKEEKDPNLKRVLYLEMTQLRSEFDYQNAMVHFQKMQLVYTAFIRLVVPPLVFASLIFLPLGIGIPVLAAGLALAHQSYRLAGAEPKKGKALAEFDETAFQAFKAKPAPTIKDLPSFFGDKKKIPARRDDDQPAPADGSVPAAP